MYITVDVFYYMTGHYICQLKIKKILYTIYKVNRPYIYCNIFLIYSIFVLFIVYTFTYVHILLIMIQY